MYDDYKTIALRMKVTQRAPPLNHPRKAKKECARETALERILGELLGCEQLQGD